MTDKTEQNNTPDVPSNHIEDEDVFNAMMRFSADFKGVAKDSTGNHGSKYAHIDNLWLAMRHMLLEYGLIATTAIHGNSESGYAVILRVCKVEDGNTGYYESMLPIQRNADPQKIAGQLTYYRRYLLVTAFNITGAVEDDDGEYASKPPTLSEDQQADMMAKADELFGDDAADMLKTMCDKLMGVKRVADIPANSYNTAIRALEKKAASLQ